MVTYHGHTSHCIYSIAQCEDNVNRFLIQTDTPAPCSGKGSEGYRHGGAQSLNCGEPWVIVGTKPLDRVRKVCYNGNCGRRPAFLERGVAGWRLPFICEEPGGNTDFADRQKTNPKNLIVLRPG